MMTTNQAPDWERIEVDYRVGIRSLRDIAAAHGITEGAIRKRARRDYWERNLSAKVKARADTLVRKSMVRAEVRAESATEKQAIEIAATVQATVRLSHQSGAKKLQKLVTELIAELEGQTAKQAPLKDRAITAKTLIDAFGRLVAIEREAHGINSDDAPDDDPIGNLLKNIKARTIQPVADDPDLVGWAQNQNGGPNTTTFVALSAG